MYTTLNKQFEFSSSHRCFRPGWSEQKNVSLYGREAFGERGHGHNFQANFVFRGPIDAERGMIINFYDIKQIILSNVLPAFDHKYLNEASTLFPKSTVPTYENIGRSLFLQTSRQFKQTPATLEAVNLKCSGKEGVTVYKNGMVERYFTIQLFQKFGSGKDSVNYPLTVRVVINDDFELESGLLQSHPSYNRLEVTLKRAHRESFPDSIEGYNQYLSWAYDELSSKFEVSRLVAYFGSMFRVEWCGPELSLISVEDTFFAAHRLNNVTISEEKNKEYFGPCYYDHGHEYKVLLSANHRFISLNKLKTELTLLLNEFSYKYLNSEVDAFHEKLTTSEFIAANLWERLNAVLGNSIIRLRLNETRNNRVTIRRYGLNNEE